VGGERDPVAVREPDVDQRGIRPRGVRDGDRARDGIGLRNDPEALRGEDAASEVPEHRVVVDDQHGGGHTRAIMAGAERAVVGLSPQLAAILGPPPADVRAARTRFMAGPPVRSALVTGQCAP
jgi:hypothetical protein